MLKPLLPNEDRCWIRDNRVVEAADNGGAEGGNLDEIQFPEDADADRPTAGRLRPDPEPGVLD